MHDASRWGWLYTWHIQYNPSDILVSKSACSVEAGRQGSTSGGTRSSKVTSQEPNTRRARSVRSGHAAAVHSTLATRQYGSIYDVGNSYTKTKAVR